MAVRESDPRTCPPPTFECAARKRVQHAQRAETIVRVGDALSTGAMAASNARGFVLAPRLSLPREYCRPPRARKRLISKKTLLKIRPTSGGTSRFDAWNKFLDDRRLGNEGRQMHPVELSDGNQRLFNPQFESRGFGERTPAKEREPASAQPEFPLAPSRPALLRRHCPHRPDSDMRGWS